MGSEMCIRDSTETIFENRMTHVNFLNQMGASITVDNNIANITGVNKLKGMNLVGSDLRSSAALIIAALTSVSTNYVYGLDHLDRGYEGFESKLKNLGVKVKREYSVESRNKIGDLSGGTSDINLKAAWVRRKQHWLAIRSLEGEKIILKNELTNIYLNQWYLNFSYPSTISGTESCKNSNCYKKVRGKFER